MSDNYMNRVSKIFERINSIQNNVEEEKQTRIKLILGALGSFESSLASINKQRAEKLQDLTEKIYSLQSQLNLEFEKRSQNESKFEHELSLVEKNCRRLIDAFVQERLDSDKKQYQRFTGQIDTLTREVEKEFESGNSQQPYFNALISDELPALRAEIDNEIQVRGEIEQKVQSQFIQQLDELKILCAEEREDREAKEEELVNVLKGIAGKVQESLQRTKMQREENEESLLKLIEQVVEKLKREMGDRWNEANILRFLYANKFKFDKTFKAIQTHSEWRQQKLPAKFTSNIQNFLKSGAIYIHGRDHRFRPILVFKPYKLSLKELIKKVLSSMQHHFRSRLFQMYILNSPKSINMIWGMVKGFLEESTVQKISILQAPIPEILYTHTHRSQIEVSFGGLSPNLTDNFWPPHFPSPQYLLSNEDKESVLINRSKYVELFEQGALKRNIICRDLIELKSNKPVQKDFNFSTPNPDHEEVLSRIIQQENSKVAGAEISVLTGKKLDFSDCKNEDLWAEGMEIEEEKNNIKSLIENKFRMKSFLDAKFEQNSFKKLKL